MSGHEEHPIVVVQVSIGAGHVLTLQVGSAKLTTKLHRMRTPHMRHQIGDIDIALAVIEVPGIANAGARALRHNIHSWHQRRQAANCFFNRVVDTER